MEEYFLVDVSFSASTFGFVLNREYLFLPSLSGFSVVVVVWVLVRFLLNVINREWFAGFLSGRRNVELTGESVELLVDSVSEDDSSEDEPKVVSIASSKALVDKDTFESLESSGAGVFLVKIPSMALPSSECLSSSVWLTLIFVLWVMASSIIEVTTLVQVDVRYTEATGSVAGVTINTLTFSLGRVVVVVIIFGGSASSSSSESTTGSSSSLRLCLSSADEVSMTFGLGLLRVTYLQEIKVVLNDIQGIISHDDSGGSKIVKWLPNS